SPSERPPLALWKLTARMVPPPPSDSNRACRSEPGSETAKPVSPARPRGARAVAPPARGAALGRPAARRHCAISMARSCQNTPARGPPPHSPSDSPGRLSQRKACTSGSPVSVVGGLPILRPGGLHHSLFGAGPAPLRLVSITNGAPPTSSLTFLPYSMFSSVKP